MPRDTIFSQSKMEAESTAYSLKDQARMKSDPKTLKAAVAKLQEEGKVIQKAISAGKRAMRKSSSTPSRKSR